MTIYKLNLSPKTEVSVLIELAKGEDSLIVRQHFKLNRPQIKSIITKYVPGFEVQLLAGTLPSEYLEGLLEFLQVVDKLLDIRRKFVKGENALIMVAQDELQQLLSFPSFSTSSYFILSIGMQCLTEWRKYKDRILRYQREFVKSPFKLSDNETLSLLELLERFAQLFPRGSSVDSMLPVIAKDHGSLLLRLGNLQGASLVFERAAKIVRDRGQTVQFHYLTYFSNLTAFRMAWKELNLNEAYSYFEKAVKIAQEFPKNAFPEGVYWGLDDLKRDELLLKATESANDGHILEAVGFLSEWLIHSKELEHTSPHFPHVFTMKLALEFLEASGSARTELRIKLRQYLINSNISYRGDLYCFHIIEAVRFRSVQPDEAAKSIAKLIPRDADVQQAEVDDVKEIAAEFEKERQDLTFMPPWIMAWLQDSREPKRQDFALQIYSCCLAEYYSAHFGLSKPSVFDGFDWAKMRIRALLECNIRHRAHFENFLNMIEHISETNPLEIVRQSTGLLFPHIVRPLSVSPENVESPKTVHFERLWEREPRTLQFSTSGEEIWHRGYYYYLNPRLNFHTLGRLKRAPHESFEPVLARLYGEPNPNPVVLVVEGPTEESLFQCLLDQLYPAWRVLNIHIHVGRGAGGTYLQVIETLSRQYPQADFLLVYDEDARNFMEEDKSQWPHAQDIIASSRHFIMTPDIEGVSPIALLDAMKTCWPSVVFSEESILPLLEDWIQREGYRSNSKDDRTFYKVKDLIQRTKKAELAVEMDKGRIWGEHLADAMLRVGVPSNVNAVLEHLLVCARGLVLYPSESIQ